MATQANPDAAFSTATGCLHGSGSLTHDTFYLISDYFSEACLLYISFHSIKPIETWYKMPQVTVEQKQSAFTICGRMTEQIKFFQRQPINLCSE